MASNCVESLPKFFEPFLGYYDYVGEKSAESADTIIFKCKQRGCGKEILAHRKTAGNLTSHLKRRHPLLGKDLNEAKTAVKRKRESSPSQPTIQKCLRLDNSRRTVIGKADLDNYVMDLLLNENLPFNLLDSEHFKHFVNGLTGQENTLLCRNTANKRLETKYEDMVNGIIKTLGAVDYVCVTADCWTSHHRSFLGMTCHYLDENLAVKSLGLACRRLKGKHTFDKLASAIDSVLRQYRLQNKTVRIVTDNGSNFVKAFRIFSQDDSPEDKDAEDADPVTTFDIFRDDGEEDEAQTEIVLPPHHRCAAHTLNLIASKDTEAALQNQTFKTAYRSMFAKATAIWNKQSRAVTSAEAIQEIANRKLVVPNATRWNSTFDAVQCLSALSAEQLRKICDALGLTNFTTRDLDLMREFVLVMGPLARCLDFLQGERCTGLGSLLPQLETLKGRIERIKPTLCMCKPLADSVLKGVQARFLQSYNDRDCLLAAVSDPRRKLTWTNDVQLQESCRTALNVEIMSSEPTSPIKEDDNDEADFLTFDVVENSTVSTYLLCPPGSLATLNGFPKVKKIFVRTNTILPSSASVERLFSCAGLVLTPIRSKVSDEHLEAKVLLKFNVK